LKMFGIRYRRRSLVVVWLVANSAIYKYVVLDMFEFWCK
jgi:hypothetical protein